MDGNTDLFQVATDIHRYKTYTDTSISKGHGRYCLLHAGFRGLSRQFHAASFQMLYKSASLLASALLLTDLEHRPKRLVLSTDSHMSSLDLF